MPTTYTHYRFGKEVINALPKPLQQSIESYRQLFDIGVHGPDILFYYHFFYKNRINQAGVMLHERASKAFFTESAEIIKKSPNPAAARAYIYGFITHFVLDSECHKYIEKMIQESGISHHEIEAEFDRYLLVASGRNPLTYIRTRHIRPTMEHAEVIAPFYKDITAGQIKKALQSQILIHKILQAKTPQRRDHLYRIMKVTRTYKSSHGLIINQEPNPGCEAYCALLMRLYRSAIPMAAGLMLNFQKHLFEHEELAVGFDETFGAGDNWERLII
ncbi:MAG: zinc dependent phospholipase C family protein [Lachnospiraceae bacterium]|nr:zinc dependent phospholipase C family protein [Lachnospiraceae bacterium]